MSTLLHCSKSCQRKVTIYECAVQEVFYYAAEALTNMDLQELTDFIIEKGKNRFPDHNAVAKAILKATAHFLPFTQDGE